MTSKYNQEGVSTLCKTVFQFALHRIGKGGRGPSQGDEGEVLTTGWLLWLRLLSEQAGTSATPLPPHLMEPVSPCTALSLAHSTEEGLGCSLGYD